MRPHAAIIATALCGLACAPPDPVALADTGVDTAVPASEPTIRILFPEVDDNGQVTLELSDDCSIQQLFVFDVDFFDLRPPAVDDDSEGEGHIHLTVGPNYLATEKSSIEYVATGIDGSSDLVPDAGQFGVLSATLQENNHDDLDRNQFPESIHNLEYVVSDPSGGCL